MKTTKHFFFPSITFSYLLLTFLTLLTTQVATAQVPSYVPTNGLIGYWPFIGNTNDVSGNNLNGTVTGATLTADRNGNANSAYLFNPSVASNISINTQPLTGVSIDNEFSIVMWVKPNRVANFISESSLCIGSVSVPMANSNQNWASVPGSGGANKLGVGFSIGTNGIMVSEHANNILVSRLSYASTYNDFVQVVIVYSLNNSYLYVNGVLVRTRTMYCSSNPKFLAAQFQLGSVLYSPNFSGVIDEFGIWNRALTLTEVQTLYNTCSTPTPSGASIQTFCAGATVANLTATGTNIQWYASSAGGTALPSTTALVNGTTYYASQTSNGCESTSRFAVTAGINNSSISATSATICNGQSTTLTVNSSATSNFALGSVGPAGGYVFYDQGAVINGWRYLEAMPSDVYNSNNYGSGCYCTSILNTSNIIGSGLTNTASWANAGCPAVASNYTYAGFSNWFVPSKDELNLMYTNLKLNSLGNFQNLQYWSSSPASYGSCGINGGAWVQNFTNGNQISEYRNGYQGSGNLRLIRQFSTGVDPTTYLWSTGATAQTINVSPTSTTTFTCAITTNGVTCTQSITITVDLPAATITPATSTTFCQGGSVVLNANTGTGLTYQWRLNGTDITGATNASYTATTSGSYTVVVTNTSTCSATSTATVVTVNALPTATITPATTTTFCQGGSVVLTANTGTGLSYQWRLNGTNITGATSSSYTANANGSYTVVVTNTSTCSATSSATVVIVNALPTATITAATATTFCQGGSVVLNANTGTGLTYQWFNNAAIISGATSATYTANTSGSYTVVITNTSTCSASSSATVVTVNALPTATITPATATTFCQGGSVMLNANTGAGLSYQ